MIEEKECTKIRCGSIWVRIRCLTPLKVHQPRKRKDRPIAILTFCTAMTTKRTAQRDHADSPPLLSAGRYLKVLAALSIADCRFAAEALVLLSRASET